MHKMSEITCPGSCRTTHTCLVPQMRLWIIDAFATTTGHSTSGRNAVVNAVKKEGLDLVQCKQGELYMNMATPHCFTAVYFEMLAMNCNVI